MILSAWFFSRWMALIYLAAFWSLGVQVLGLIGQPRNFTYQRISAIYPA